MRRDPYVRRRQREEQLRLRLQRLRLRRDGLELRRVHARQAVLPRLRDVLERAVVQAPVEHDHVRLELGAAGQQQHKLQAAHTVPGEADIVLGQAVKGVHTINAFPRTPSPRRRRRDCRTVSAARTRPWP